MNASTCLVLDFEQTLVPNHNSSLYYLKMAHVEWATLVLMSLNDQGQWMRQSVTKKWCIKPIYQYTYPYRIKYCSSMLK